MSSNGLVIEGQEKETEIKKWRESTGGIKELLETRNQEEMLVLKERQIEELRNVIISQRLVHTIQQRAIVRHCEENQNKLEIKLKSQSHDSTNRIRQLETELNDLNERHSLLLVEKSFNSSKILNLERQVTDIRQTADEKIEQIELENQLQIKQITERLTTEHKETLNTLVDTYHRQISELQLEHSDTLTLLEEKFTQEQEKREQELETTICQELSQVGTEIEKRLGLLELDQKQRETQYTNEIHQLKVELEKGEEKHNQERLNLLNEIQHIKEIMASEKETIIKKHKEEYQKLKKRHEAQIQQVKAQLEAATQLSEQHHMEDNQTLQALHTNLQQVQNERDTLQSALVTLYSSVTSLLPVTTVSDTNLTLTPPATEWTTPTHHTGATNMTTPTNNISDKFPKTISTEDSGLASQQTSVGRGPLLSMNNGSVLRTLRSQEDTPTHEMIPPSANLSISRLHDGEEGEEFGVGSDNLTILSLNSSMEAPPTWELMELDTPTSQSVQAMISKLYQSVSHLVNSFISSSTQASQYQHELVQAHEELVKSQTDLTHQLKCVEELQTKVHSLQNDLIKHETKEGALESAQEKISQLISEIEALHQKCQEHQITQERETPKLNQMMETLNQEKTNLLKRISTLEKDLLLSQKEKDAQRDALHNLQEKTERAQLQYRNEVESLKAKEKKLSDQLNERESRLRELEDLPGQLTAKQLKEEELQETIKQLTSQITNALHRSALADSVDDLRQQLDNYQQQIQKQKERYDDLLKTYEESVTSLTCASEELESEKTMREKLLKEHEKIKKQLEMKDNEIEQLILIKDEAQDQCNELHDQISTLTSQVDNLTSGLKMSSEQVAKLCHNLEERDNQMEEMSQGQLVDKRQVEELQEEASHHLKAFEQSILQIQALKDELNHCKELLSKEKENVNSMKASKAIIEKEVVNLKEQLSERESHHQLEVKNLHAEFCLKETEMKRLHKQELQDLEDKLQVEHAGETALLKIQLKEISAATVDSKVLQKIAEITPNLEQDAHDVLKLCKGEGSIIEQLQLASNETVKSLNDTNESLRHDISLAESSMQLANTALTNLKTELEESKKREIELQQELEVSTKRERTLQTELELSKNREASLQQEFTNHSGRAERKLTETQKGYNKQLEQLKKEGERKLAKLSQSHKKLLQDYKNLESSSREKEKELQRDYQLLQKELEAAHGQSVQSNIALEENIKLVQKLMQQLDEVKNGETQNQHIQMLREALDKKENELSQTVNEFLEEKLKVAKLRGEKSSLQSRLSSPEKLQATDVNIRERFEQEKASLLSALESAESKIHRLSTIARSTDRRCKSLVFQKRYLSSELDAFYHTHQAALLMIQDMGGIPWQPPPRPTISYTTSFHKFKKIGLVVLAAVRLKLLTSRRKRNRSAKGGHIPVANQIVYSV